MDRENIFLPVQLVQHDWRTRFDGVTSVEALEGHFGSTHGMVLISIVLDPEYFISLQQAHGGCE